MLDITDYYVRYNFRTAYRRVIVHLQVLLRFKNKNFIETVEWNSALSTFSGFKSGYISKCNITESIHFTTYKCGTAYAYEVFYVLHDVLSNLEYLISLK